MKFQDERIKLTTEILNGIKVLKFYSWEKPFMAKVEDVRRKEVEILETRLQLKVMGEKADGWKVRVCQYVKGVLMRPSTSDSIRNQIPRPLAFLFYRISFIFHFFQSPFLSANLYIAVLIFY